MTLEKAANWFATIWDNYNSFAYFDTYKKKNPEGREWADEDLKAILG